MEIAVTVKFYSFGNECWYKKYYGASFTATEHGNVYIIENTEENRKKLEEKEKEKMVNDILTIPKEHAQILDGLPYLAFEVGFNDGGWHSGGLPSENIAARVKAEAIYLAIQKRPLYKDWDSWATPIEFEGYELVLIPKKAVENDKA